MMTITGMPLSLLEIVKYRRFFPLMRTSRIVVWPVESEFMRRIALLLVWYSWNSLLLLGATANDTNLLRRTFISSGAAGWILPLFTIGEASIITAPVVYLSEQTENDTSSISSRALDRSWIPFMLDRIDTNCTGSCGWIITSFFARRDSRCDISLVFGRVEDSLCWLRCCSYVDAITPWVKQMSDNSHRLHRVVRARSAAPPIRGRGLGWLAPVQSLG